MVFHFGANNPSWPRHAGHGDGDISLAQIPASAQPCYQCQKHKTHRLPGGDDDERAMIAGRNKNMWWERSSIAVKINTFRGEAKDLGLLDGLTVYVVRRCSIPYQSAFRRKRDLPHRRGSNHAARPPNQPLGYI